MYLFIFMIIHYFGLVSKPIFEQSHRRGTTFATSSFQLVEASKRHNRLRRWRSFWSKKVKFISFFPGFGQLSGKISVEKNNVIMRERNLKKLWGCPQKNSQMTLEPCWNDKQCAFDVFVILFWKNWFVQIHLIKKLYVFWSIWVRWNFTIPTPRTPWLVRASLRVGQAGGGGGEGQMAYAWAVDIPIFSTIMERCLGQTGLTDKMPKFLGGLSTEILTFFSPMNFCREIWPFTALKWCFQRGWWYARGNKNPSRANHSWGAQGAVTGNHDRRGMGGWLAGFPRSTGVAFGSGFTSSSKTRP